MGLHGASHRLWVGVGFDDLDCARAKANEDLSQKKTC